MAAWILAGLMLAAAWPWARWLTNAESGRASSLLPALLTLAIGTGALCLTMFWLAMAGPPLRLANTTLVYLLAMLPGAWLWWRDGHALPRFPLPAGRAERLALALLLPLVAAVLLNSAWWPFSRSDAVAIYEKYALQIYASGALVPLPGADTLYEAYPVLMSLGYAWTWLAAGWPNEFLARVLGAMLSLGCLGATWQLAAALYNRRAAWLATLLLALAPTYGDWASSGYVDLPMAFFHALAALCAWRMWQDRRWQDALLAGLLAGLAAWTKNVGLISCGLLALWCLGAAVRGRVSPRMAALAAGSCLLVAAPWYLRVLLEAGLFIPDTVWSDQARPDLSSLLILLTKPTSYGLVGPGIMAGLLLAIGKAMRRRKISPQLGLLLWWTLPLYAVWWFFASYDHRFVLLFLPLLTVAGAAGLEPLWPALAKTWRRRMAPVLILAGVALALLAAWNALEYKRALFANPLMDIGERRALVWRERQPQRVLTPGGPAAGGAG